MWDGHLESQKNPDRLKRSIHIDRIGVHSTFVSIYAVLRVLMTWANCFFLFNMSFLFRKVEDVTTISKSQSLTSVSIKDCTLRVPNTACCSVLQRVAACCSVLQYAYRLGASIYLCRYMLPLSYVSIHHACRPRVYSHLMTTTWQRYLRVYCNTF